MKCKNCDKEVKGSGTIYCSANCKELVAAIKKEMSIAKKSQLVLGLEGQDYVVCKWCNMKVKRIYGIHMISHHPEKTSKDYKKEFPYESLACAKDKENTSKNSGLHMKKDRYRQVAKEKMTGKNNPNHKSKTSIEERQRRSPFSQKFVSYENLDNKELAVKEFVKDAIKDRLTESQYDYWLTKFNGDKVKAKEVYKERQKTFTLEKCISKHGEEDGLKIWKDRQSKWSLNIEAKYKNGKFTRFCKHNYSNSELAFLTDLINKFNPLKNYYCALPGNTQFFKYFKDAEITHSYDFVYNRKIIEFNGDYWHCNPSKFSPTDYHSVIKMTAAEKWAADSKKINLIKKEGYEVLVIWESEYHKDPELTLKKCIDFLND